MEQIIVSSELNDFTGGILGNPLVYGFLILIVSVFLINTLRVLSGYRKINSNLSKCHKNILALFEVHSFKGLLEKLEENSGQQIITDRVQDGSFREVFLQSKLDDSWRQIVQNIMWFSEKPQPYVGLGVIDEAVSVKKIRNLFLIDRLDKRGSLFTALGVLGTFVGLTYGVASASSGLASPDISLARQAMTELLSGAELAFLTSLAGLVFSMIYSMMVDKKKDNVSTQVLEFQRLMHILFPPVDPAFAAAQQTVALREGIDKWHVHHHKNAQAMIEHQNKTVQELMGVRASLSNLSVNVEYPGQAADLIDRDMIKIKP